MKEKAVRVILAFYSAKDDEPDKAFEGLRRAGTGQTALFRRDGAVLGSTNRRLQPYAQLRLESESLIVASVPSPDVQAITKRLLGDGSPVVFVVRGDLAAACSAMRTSPPAGKISVLARLQHNQHILDSVRSDLLEASQLDHVLPAAAEWIVDNTYLIRTQVAEVRKHLPRDYPKILPLHSPGNPRICELAHELVRQADFALDQSSILDRLHEYQKENPLTVAELWFLPLLLRVGLIEGLAELAEHVNQAQQLRELAYLWANRLAASARLDSDAFDRMLALAEGQPCARESYFVTSLAEQLQDEEAALAPMQRWIEDRFKTTVGELVRSEHTRETAQRQSTANAFSSLRGLARIDFTEIFEAASVVETELRGDPGGVYARSDFSTRDRCRRVVERIARGAGVDERTVAQRAVQLAVKAAGDRCRGHVAFYLLADGVTQLEEELSARIPFQVRFARVVRGNATPIYLSGIAGLTTCLLTLALVLAWEAGVHRWPILAALGILALFPLSELSVQILNALVISFLPPDPLPKMDFENGIPEENATLIVVPMMLSTGEVVRREVEKLEVRFLANQDRHLFFSLFSDYTDYVQPTAPRDAELLNAACEGIDALNARHPGGRFLLFNRNRAWSRSEQRWIGRERKRGKIEDLNTFLSGNGSSEILIRGALPLPIRSVITLDADTQLPPSSARRLVETIAHPLNRVEVDPVTGARRRGYGVIQPRVSVALPSAMATRFTSVFADTTGTDPYCQSVSDAHQDLFGEATFHGKAIYDVQAFRSALSDRFPIDTILSHDLIEGAYAGVGLASDIELFENVPLDYASYSKREHRWIRGDWLIAPWIFPRVPGPEGRYVPNPLSIISRWRIFDNLRRSLVPVASLSLLLAGWLLSPAPGVWSLVVGLAVVIPALAPLLDRGARHMQGTVQRWQGAEAELVRAFVMIAFLPHQAWVSVDAIARVVYRRFISKRHLLEWQTAEEAGAHKPSRVVYRRMWIISLCSAALLALQYVQGKSKFTFIFLGMWIAAPELMRWLAHPGRRYVLDAASANYLRLLARRTWRYFDDLVGPASNWLPPDNSQLALHIAVAQRTSPTNIGFWLTSALAATDFGYLGIDQLAERLEHTMNALGRLERYEGHLLNWYDTRTLEPLTPRYVSTVDSGNLLASLWVLTQACRELLHRPVVGHASLRGINDTLAVVREASRADASMARTLEVLSQSLQGKLAGHHLIARLLSTANSVEHMGNLSRTREANDEASYWTSRLAQQLQACAQSIDRYLHWMEILSQPPDSFVQSLGRDAVKLRRRALRELPSLLSLSGLHTSSGSTALDALLVKRSTPNLRPEVAEWMNQVARAYEQARSHALEAVRRFENLADACQRLADGINMSFLYDRDRRLFSIGYAVGGPVQFQSHYDLLASESRLASFVAIAKGDVPQEHWFALARPRVAEPHGRQALLSWSGTMFEYLMPLIFMHSYDHSLLDHACREAVRQQIEFGQTNAVPWGASESAYSALDANQVYQYRAFGVPGLALSPSREEELVMAPYATTLALLVDPAMAIANLHRLEEFQLAGPMGFYESIDFGLEATQDGERGVPIFTYMAHHQGMSLMALDEILHRDSMRQRFHCDVRVRAVESLLYERIPITSPATEETQPSPPAVRLGPREEPTERNWREDTAIPRTHLQGNGTYQLMVTNSGSGYSRWREIDLTRWRCDPTLDNWGSYIYIRDLKSNAVWGASHQPIAGEMDLSSARFSADRAEFQRRSSGVETVLAVTVAPADDIELRRLTITNRSLRTRELELTSYAELALAPHRTDSAHPVFAKMFVETECLPDSTLMAHRRQRSPDESPVWAAHRIIGVDGDIQYETDRAKFLGRANTAARPDALTRRLSGSSGTVLDPIFSLRCTLTLQPRERVEITFATGAASSRDDLLGLMDRYRRPESVARAFEMSWTRAQLDFRYLGIGPTAAHRFQEVAGYLMYPNPRMRAATDRLMQNRLGQSGLWAQGISGDLPILSVTVSDVLHLPLVRELLLAHTYWRLRGFRADLVILNQESPSYDRPFQVQLLRLIQAHSEETGLDRPGGVFLRDWYAIPEGERNLILTASNVVLIGSRGPLQQQLVSPESRPQVSRFIAAGAPEEASAPLPFLELPYFNGIGGFTSDGREYAIYLNSGSNTPAPWSNVFANPNFGALVTESGLGFTWYGNSQTNRLTPWHNDPLSDPQSEVIYLRDDDSGQVWTPTPLPIREMDAYRARHGQGYTVFEHNSHAIEQELTVLVPVQEEGGDPIKICRLRLRNASPRPRRLAVFYFAEWVLGSTRENQLANVRVSRDEQSAALLATQFWNAAFSGHLAFAACSPRPSSYSGDRTGFLGRNGSREKPAGLARAALDNRLGPTADPAAALQVTVTIQAGQSQDVIFLLGQGNSVEEVRLLVTRYGDAANVEAALAATRAWWDAKLGVVQVKTPILSTDFLLNRWLLYQALSCRFWARSGFYQSSGAFGFRDQLQDAMAFVYAAPELTRKHILACAARQFVEGDVQHWWHAETGVGVRTRCSDDLVWLPYVVADYIAVTGDTAILKEEVALLEGAVLKDGEKERMFIPGESVKTAALSEHCIRALDHAWRLGLHGLPLFGTGDWNDGMNLVGAEGRGESVWLAWFLCSAFEAFADVMETAGAAPELPALWRKRTVALAAALDSHGWDGDWYLRGFFDNGAPLGSRVNLEARIDSLAQSWAALSGAASAVRARHAMDAADRFLANSQHRLVLLFTPPFDHSTPHPGYIMGYPPGLRENGGQYTHGSLWMAAAWARLGEGDAAVRLLTFMNPVEHCRNSEMVERYRGEPYVSAGDVSFAPGRVGQCGWTWYTGSAAWMYRIWLEDILGFRLRGAELTFAPAIPAHWDEFAIHYRYRSTTFEITARRGTAAQIVLELDATTLESKAVELVDDGRVHQITVWIPQKTAESKAASNDAPRRTPSLLSAAT